MTERRNSKQGKAAAIRPGSQEVTMGTPHRPPEKTVTGEFNSCGRTLAMLGIAGGVAFATGTMPAQAQTAPAQGQKPNILVIFGDDIGWSNISAYNMGMMGSRTPNIDRLAKEGAIFTDYYGQQSSTAGRA
ncbi:MAG TPA: sulfatase-like hydrolase/transferase, partial [Verrucomicrobiota bacterium]|nr:sulfatase-like hydrolase/transferase [Verrucomicrobiota bacterium]